MSVDLRGKVIDQAGAAKNGLTVELWEAANWEADNSRTSSTTTDADGLWTFDSQDATKTWIIVVIDGTKKFLLDARNRLQLTKLDLITDLQVDTINEHTAAAGVTIENVLLKDGVITIAGNVLPSADDTHDLGSAAAAWQDLFIEGDITLTDAGAIKTTAGILTLDSGAAINIEPASGSAILLDGTISIDAGVVTGASAITLSGELDAGSLDISGDADIDGTLETDALTIGGTNVLTGSLITTLGTISAGVWNGTAITGAYINDDIVSGQAEITSGLAAADELLYSDAGTVKRVGVDTLTTYLAGVNAGTVTSTGLSDSSGVISLDIQNMTASTSIADADLIVIDDGAGGTLRKMTRANFIESAALDSVNIDGGAIDGATIGAASHTTIKGTTIDATTDFTIGNTIITDGVITDSSGIQFAAALDFNNVDMTNVDIDSGAIDGTIIGAASAAAGSFAALVATTATLSGDLDLGDDQQIRLGDSDDVLIDYESASDRLVISGKSVELSNNLRVEGGELIVNAGAGTAGGLYSGIRNQQTTTVDNNAETIYAQGFGTGAYCIIQGDDSGGAEISFLDVVVLRRANSGFSGDTAGSGNYISATTTKGSPATRTYTMTAERTLALEMGDTNEMDVHVTAIL